MKKVILLSRVSTKYQTYKAQTKELKEFANRDGYNDSEMEIIEDKESATKLSDEERQGLNKMYAAINNPNNQIECVYCWELSRISRKPQTLYKIKEELINRKINLRIKDKNFSLFNDKKEIDSTSELIFGIYITFCENEIRVKNDRAQRAKINKALNSGYNGGNIKYGYTNYIPAPTDLDPNKKEKTKNYHIDKEQGEIVKLLFELYATGKYGFAKLHRELISRGKNVNIRIIGQILRSKEYTGEKIPEHKYTERIKGKERIITRYERSYPPIISKELFEKCRKVAIKNNNHIDKSKTIYYANKLIKCSCCGSALVAIKKNVIYRCMHKYSTITKRECSGNDSINMNVIDSILWRLASLLELIFITDLEEKQLFQWENEIKELQTKADNTKKQLEIIKSNKRNQLRKLLSTLSESELEKLVINETQKDKHRIEQEKTIYLNEIGHIKYLIEEAKQSSIKVKSFDFEDIADATFSQYDKIMESLDNTTEKQRYDIIHKHIKEVTVCNIPELKATKQIDIKCYNGKTETYYYSFRSKDKSKQIFQKIKVNQDLEHIEYYNYDIRFTK